MEKAFVAKRVSLPKLEAYFPWISGVLDSYALMDASLERELASAFRPPACRPGCAACCKQPIPVSLAELMLINLWIKQEKILPWVTSGKDGQGGESEQDKRLCPFLRGGSCAVYAVRPLACRRFLVFGQCCSEGEDVTSLRPQDVHRPSRRALAHALSLTLPFYLEYGLAQRGQEPELAFYLAQTTIMQQVSWAGRLEQEGLHSVAFEPANKMLSSDLR